MFIIFTAHQLTLCCLGGQRNWLQVLCNGGVAAYLALIYFVESGSGEHPIDFRYHYRQSWLSIAILSTASFINSIYFVLFIIGIQLFI